VIPPAPAGRRIAIILPAFNEEATIRETVHDFHAHLPAAEIVVVDNNSSDRTQARVEEAARGVAGGVRLIFEKRQGKAFALKRAFHEVEADVYVVADADLTYPAKDLAALLGPVLADEADMVVGDRLARGRYARENKRSFHDLGNRLVRLIINVLFAARMNDIMSGYRVLSRGFVKSFPMLSGGFEVETEITLHALDKRFRVLELPVEYRDRPVGSASKLNTFRDGYRVLRTILLVFKDYKPFVFFSALSALFFAGSLACGAPVILEFIRIRFITHVPLALLATGLMILSLMMFCVGLILDTVARYHRFDYEHRILQHEPRRARRPAVRQRRLRPSSGAAAQAPEPSNGGSAALEDAERSPEQRSPAARSASFR
jgi:glycosyltransferase involved in cell wall biosynthesis